MIMTLGDILHRVHVMIMQYTQTLPSEVASNGSQQLFKTILYAFDYIEEEACKLHKTPL